MQIYLLRHGRTADNDAHRYQGTRDTPLSPEGEAELCPAEFAPDQVYHSPRSRARRTAELLFPTARLIPVEGLREMDFGVFEGRSADEMAEDPAYRAWVDSGCKDRCPGGESRDEFFHRVCAAFSDLVTAALAAGEERVVIVGHGGTQMAALTGFALPRREYFQWFGPNGGGFLLETDAARWAAEKTMQLVQPLSYVGEEGEC